MEDTTYIVTLSILPTESKVRTFLCSIINSTTGKNCLSRLTGFNKMVTLKDFISRLKSSNPPAQHNKQFGRKELLRFFRTYTQPKVKSTLHICSAYEEGDRPPPPPPSKKEKQKQRLTTVTTEIVINNNNNNNNKRTKRRPKIVIEERW